MKDHHKIKIKIKIRIKIRIKIKNEGWRMGRESV